MKHPIPRRTFLKHGALAAAALTLPARVVVGRGPRKVVVPGAGLAGLAAGYGLTKVGHEVTLLEAQERREAKV
jgi:NADPH-dependent 2,4-dienoyl-CoA reductase/sulfur reductase-like enzyme